MFSLNAELWDVSSGITWSTRLSPTVESVRVASSVCWKSTFSGLQAAMTPTSGLLD